MGAVSLAGLGCRRSPRLDSVLLITLDTLRADHVSCYGSSPVETPHLDALALRGARVTRAWTPIPLTTPAHASILSGLYPPAHGLRNNGRFRLPDDVTTLAEVLKAGGSRTAAFVAAFPTIGVFGLGQGFDLYDDDLGSDAAGQRRSQRPADEVVEHAAAWLAANGARPFFLWVHLYDPHFPYEPPAGYARRFPSDPYSGEVAFTDAEVGRLLDALERTAASARTVVVALADHGEGLETHGEDRHGLLLYEESLRIPFLIAAPGRIEPGGEIRGVASAVDVLPTVLGLLGKPIPAGVQGRDLLSASDAETARRRVYAETLYPREEFGWSALYAIRDGDLKYVEGPAPELFDLAADPKEEANLAESRKQDARRLAAALAEDAARLVKTERLAAAAGFSDRSDSDVVERLASLGYVGGGAGSTMEALPSVGGRNPRDALADYYALKRAQELKQAGNYGEAGRVLEGLTRSDPDNPQVWLTLAQNHHRAGRLRDGEATFRELMRRFPAFYLGYRYFSDFLAKQARFREARDLWLDLSKRTPGYVEIQVQAAKVELAGGMVVEAAQRLTAYLESHDQDAEAWTLLGRALAAAGETDKALSAFRFALDLRPTEGDALEGAINLLTRAGRKDEARRMVERLAARAPNDPILRRTLDRLR
jgi:arylsulfatase A-like enzyme/thioredoxin-like negative regulator of GroEL